MAKIDWQGLMGLGIGVLRLGPRDFWALTPRELTAALKALGLGRPAPTDRATLDSLMRQFPDGEKHGD